MALEKPTKSTRDALLAVGDDRRMWDRQTERMAKQRRDGKPIRKPTSNAGFGAGTDQHCCQPGLSYQVRGDEDEPHQDQQRGGMPAIAGQPATNRLVGRWR